MFKINHKNKKTSKHTGFAMLFTVLIVSLILSISIGISNLTLKQTILSSLAKDSQISFYQADNAVECGLLYDISYDSFPRGSDTSSVLSAISCGDRSFNLDLTESYNDYFMYIENVSSSDLPCASILFDKTSSTANRVEGRGYNICNTSPRQVERALEVNYE